MEINTLKGYTYVVTAKYDTTVTDTNGLNMAVNAGDQGVFVASSDKVTVAVDAAVTQTRNFDRVLVLKPDGGGGEVIQPGEVVLGGNHGSMTIQDVNTARSLYPGTFGDLTELPEGVTLESLESGVAPQLTSTTQLIAIFNSLMTSGGATNIGAVSMVTLFGGTTLTRLPSTINFANLRDGTYMFGLSEHLENFACDMPVLTRGVNMFSDCTQLTSYEGYTPSMTVSDNMFAGCSKLTHWKGSLESLYSGRNMFTECKLDLESVQNIANTLPNISDGHVSIGVDSTKVTQEQQDSVNRIIVNKGWTITWLRN